MIVHDFVNNPKGYKITKRKPS